MEDPIPLWCAWTAASPVHFSTPPMLRMHLRTGVHSNSYCMPVTFTFCICQQRLPRWQLPVTVPRHPACSTRTYSFCTSPVLAKIRVCWRGWEKWVFQCGCWRRPPTSMTLPRLAPTWCGWWWVTTSLVWSGRSSWFWSRRRGLGIKTSDCTTCPVLLHSLSSCSGNRSTRQSPFMICLQWGTAWEAL